MKTDRVELVAWKHAVEILTANPNLGATTLARLVGVTEKTGQLFKDHWKERYQNVLSNSK